MKQYNIAVIRGDGIGGEVIEEGIKVIDALGSKLRFNLNYTERPWGSDWYFKNLPSVGIGKTSISVTRLPSLSRRHFP